MDNQISECLPQQCVHLKLFEGWWPKRLEILFSKLRLNKLRRFSTACSLSLQSGSTFYATLPVKRIVIVPVAFYLCFSIAFNLLWYAVAVLRYAIGRIFWQTKYVFLVCKQLGYHFSSLSLVQSARFGPKFDLVWIRPVPEYWNLVAINNFILHACAKDSGKRVKQQKGPLFGWTGVIISHS